MRRSSLIAFACTVATAPLGAQGFEGTVTMKVGAGGSALQSLNMTMKDSKALIVVPVNAPQMNLNGDVKVFTDETTHKMTVLVPIAMGNSQGFKLVLDAKAGTGTAKVGATTTAPKKLGTSQSIAGYPCEDYEMSDSVKTRFCLSTALGKFTFPSMGGASGGGMGGMLGGFGMAVPDWAGAMGGVAGFPLKVWTPADNKVLMEVTAVKKGPVSADIFVIPEGYMDGSAMMGGMGRGRGGF